ncbi:MAG: hypothetical protein ACI311_00350 [Bacilli bacterium]
MSNNDELSIKFSNTTYATKQEVAKALNINAIDDIWNRIISYRSLFNKTLTVRNIDRTPYNITLTPSITTKVNAIERKFVKATLAYSKIDGEDSKNSFRKEYYVRSLYYLAKKYNISVTEEFLYSLIDGKLSTLSPSEIIIANYYRILKYIEKHCYDPIDHDLVTKIYCMFTGSDNLDTPYRARNMEDFTANITIGSYYNSAPAERIISMMEDLFSFLNNDDSSPIIKAIMAYYYVTHIKPFDVYSEEIGLILFKDVLAHNDLEDISTLIDIEMILSENEEAFNNILNEVRKTNDITYLVSYLNPVLEDIINELNNQISKVKTLEIKNEYYETPQNNVRNKERYIAENNIESFSRQTSSQVDFELNVSLPKVPIGLDEEDAAKIEEHLLEIFPTLKRGQAYFYARHCTIGKYYTISQYKKLLDVAYETARTSMDNLADLGFYRKEKLNNKFIYTPLPRR